MKSRNVRLNLTKIAQKICADQNNKPLDLQRCFVGIPKQLESDEEYLARIKSRVFKARVDLFDRHFRAEFARWL